MEENQSAYYGQYYIPLQNLEQEILQWLRKLVDAYAEQAGETPVEHIRSRIKTAEGMQEKLHKKGFETTADSALANVSDCDSKLRIIISSLFSCSFNVP